MRFIIYNHPDSYVGVYPNNIVLTIDNFYIHAILNISYHFFGICLVFRSYV